MRPYPCEGRDIPTENAAVIPAKAGISPRIFLAQKIPAFAGMTIWKTLYPSSFFRNISFTACGLALPWVAFIT